MDIIRKIFLLNNNEILNYFNQVINNSNDIINKILTQQNLDQKTKIKMLIDDTYLFDIYLSTINLMTLISNKEDYKYWCMVKDTMKKHLIAFNTNKDLLNLIGDLTSKLGNNPDQESDKIFLIKMGKSMEKFGTHTNNTDKISKILLQLEQTEDTIFNNLNKSLKLKIDRKKIDARSESIMSSVYPDDNNIVVINKKSYYYLLKKISDKTVACELETQFTKKYIDILPLVGKLLVLRNIYANQLNYKNYYLECSNKTEEETSNINDLITDLNSQINESFTNILKEIKNLLNSKLDDKKKITKLTFNNIIYALDKLTIDIKLSPIQMLQYVMLVLQKKLNIVFQKGTLQLPHNNCKVIDIHDSNKQLRGHVIIDLIKRDNKRINELTVLKLNNLYCNNLPIVYLLGNYIDLEKDNCTFSDLVILFREFGNILVNVFGIAHNGLNEIDIEIFNFIPDLMEFIAYDDFTLNLVFQNAYKTNYAKKIKELRLLKRLEMIINLKLKCANVLFDNIAHSSQDLVTQIKKSEIEDIKKILIQLNNTIMNDIFNKQSDLLDYNIFNMSFINNLTNGNQGMIYGTILSIILSFNIYETLNTQSGISFLMKLLENKEFSYRKLILSYIASLKIDYYNNFLKKCLNIEPFTENYYDEDMTQTERK